MGESWTWIAADGSRLALNGFVDGIEVIDGVKGRGMPPIRRDRSSKAGLAGSTLTALDYDTRTLEVPVMLAAPTEAALWALIRSTSSAMAPGRGDGIIQIDTNVGDTRQLICRYVEGLELDETLGIGKFPGKVVTTLVFETGRPFWQPPNYPPLLYTLNATAGAFFPLFPLRLGASQIFSEGPVDIGTDAEAYPVWTVTGPGSQLLIRNVTTGREFLYRGTLGDGEILTIDTRPREYSNDPKSVRDLAGTWLFGLLGDTSGGKRDLWPIVPGVNAVRIEISGATTSTQVRGDVLPQLLGV